MGVRCFTPRKISARGYLGSVGRRRAALVQMAARDRYVGTWNWQRSSMGKASGQVVEQSHRGHSVTDDDRRLAHGISLFGP